MRALPAVWLFLFAGQLWPVTIVVRRNAAPPEKFAAAELVKYLAQMGNPKPEIQEFPIDGDIYLGVLPDADRSEAEAALRDEDSDSFIIRSRGGKLLLYGKSPRANLYAVYHYLESLGARWYFPGRESEVIPPAPVRLEGYNLKQVPTFRKRGIVVFQSTPGFADLADFAAKVKLNTIALHSDAGLDDAAALFESRGLTLNLERHFFGESFCPDDGATFDREARRFRDYVARLPAQMNEFFLWAADKFLEPCPSPRYRDYTASDLVLSFSNRIANVLRESRPQARFAFLSYLSTWQPPKNVKAGPGILLEWAPMFQSFAHALDDPGSEVNAEYRKDFEELLKEFGAANSQVLGYWLDDTLFSRTHYGRLPYAPRALQGDLEYYHRAGVPAITTFGVITGRDHFSLHISPAVFLYPRLLWNVGADVPAAMREFCREYFGSETAVEIFNLLEQADRMVWVERHKLRAERMHDPALVEKVSRALALSDRLLHAQTGVEGRARVAKLIAEVSSRLAVVPDK
jgi:hypothetical protein